MDRLISDVNQASCSNKVKLVIVEGIMIYDDRLVHTILSTLVDSSQTQTTSCICTQVILQYIV